MEQLGDIIGKSGVVKEIAKAARRRARAVKVTEQHRKIVEAAVSIGSAAPTDRDKAYLSRFFVQCTLPHSNPGNVPIWKRRNGNLLLSITPARDKETGKSLGYPYGTIPRLLLFWMTTEAKRTHSRRLNLGSNLSQFMRDVGLSPESGGGKRSDAKRLREQIIRLFRAQISLDFSIVDGTMRGDGYQNMNVARKSVFWWDEKKPNQGSLWDSWVELGEDFFEAATTSVVPYDLRALRVLKRSPLALDLYALVNYHGGTLVGKPHFISWSMLMQQMGGDYKDEDNFRKKASAALLKVRVVLPGVRVDKMKGGIKVHPGKPAISRTTSRIA